MIRIHVDYAGMGDFKPGIGRWGKALYWYIDLDGILGDQYNEIRCVSSLESWKTMSAS
jgi:hypothetical protein